MLQIVEKKNSICDGFAMNVITGQSSELKRIFNFTTKDKLFLRNGVNPADMIGSHTVKR